MEKINFPTDDIFEKKFHAFASSRDAVRLQRKYELKPYIEKFKTARYFAVGFSYFIHILTVCASLLCAVNLLSLKMPIPVAYTLSVICVIGIEIGKRLSFAPAIKDYLQFQRMGYAQITITFILLLVSCLLVWHGTDATVKNFAVKPTLIVIDSASDFETKQINLFQKELEKVQKTQVWNGKLTAQGQSNYNNLLEQIGALQLLKNEKETKAKEQNKQIENQYNVSNVSNATYAKYITIVFDLLLFIVLAWLEYYDYRSTAEFAKNDIDKKNNLLEQNTNLINESDTNKESQDTENDNKTEDCNNDEDKNINVNGNNFNANGNNFNVNGKPIRKRIGFNNENRNENRNNENRNENRNNENRNENRNNENRNNENRNNIRVCEHCQKEYDLRHHKQKYCNDTCRIEHWEKEKGKKLNKNKK